MIKSGWRAPVFPRPFFDVYPFLDFIRHFFEKKNRLTFWFSFLSSYYVILGRIVHVTAIGFVWLFSHAGSCLFMYVCLLVSIVCFHLIWITRYHWGNRVLRVYKRERRRCRPSISLISSPWKSTETRLVYWNNKSRWESKEKERDELLSLSL